MALYESFMVPCRRVGKSRIPDGEGGWTTQWVDGASFDAAIVLDSTISAIVAEAQGVTGVYTVTTDKGTRLGFHDVFRRVSDGKVFRVVRVNDPTPAAASFQFNQVRADEWSLE